MNRCVWGTNLDVPEARLHLRLGGFTENTPITFTFRDTTPDNIDSRHERLGRVGIAHGGIPRGRNRSPLLYPQYSEPDVPSSRIEASGASSARTNQNGRRFSAPRQKAVLARLAALRESNDETAPEGNAGSQLETILAIRSKMEEYRRWLTK